MSLVDESLHCCLRGAGTSFRPSPFFYEPKLHRRQLIAMSDLQTEKLQLTTPCSHNDITISSSSWQFNDNKFYLLQPKLST